MDLSEMQGESHPGVSDEELNCLTDQVGPSLPNTYIQLLRLSNGFRFDNGSIIYASSEVFERNNTFQVIRYEPTKIAIGDDGGGYLVLIEKLTGDESQVFAVEAGSIGSLTPTVLSSSIRAWVEQRCPIDIADTHGDYPDFVDVILEKLPEHGLKTLIDIKNELGIDVSLGELKRNAENLPACILKNVPYGKFRKRCQKLNQRFGDCLSLRDSE